MVAIKNEINDLILQRTKNIEERMNDATWRLESQQQIDKKDLENVIQNHIKDIEFKIKKIMENGSDNQTFQNSNFK